MTIFSRNIYLVSLVFIILLLSIFLLLSGITKESTTEILMYDHKFGSRAMIKANIHGESLMPFILERKTDIPGLSSYNTRLLLKYFNNTKPKGANEISNSLINDGKLINRLIGYAILSSANGEINESYLLEVNDVLCNRKLDNMKQIEKYEYIWLSLYVANTTQKGDISCVKEILRNKDKYPPRILTIAGEVLD